MRCNALFYASFLPTIFAQSAVSVGSGIAHPTGGLIGNDTAKWSNNTKLAIPSLSANTTNLHPLSTSTPASPSLNSTVPFSSRWNSSKPLSGTGGVCRKKTKTSMPLSNSTPETAKPIGTGIISGNAHQEYPKTAGGFFTNSTQPPKPTSTVSGTGRLPFTKGGAHFMNSTSAEQVPVGTAASFHPSGTGASSEFVKPTGSHAQNTSVSASGRLPFTKSSGVFFGNSTSVAGSTGTDNAHVAGTGPSSGFAKPTGAENLTRSASESGRLPFTRTAGPVFTNTPDGDVLSTAAHFHSSGTGAPSGFAKPTGATNFTKPSSWNVTRPVVGTGSFPITKTVVPVLSDSTSSVPSTSATVSSSSGRLPFTKPSGLIFTNSTLVALPSGTAPPKTQIPSSGVVFPSGTGSPFHTKPVVLANATSTNKLVSSGTGQPFTKTAGAIFTNSTSGTAPHTAILSSGAVFPSGTRIPQHTEPVVPVVPSNTTPPTVPSSKSTLPVFTNSTSGIPPSKGAFPTGTSAPFSISTALHQVNTTSISLPSSVTPTPFSILNTTPSNLLSAMSKTKKGHHHQATVTVTVTASAFPVTVTETDVSTQTLLPTISSSSGEASESDTLTVTVTQSASTSSSSAFSTGKVQVQTFSANSTAPVTATFSSLTATSSAAILTSTSPLSTASSKFLIPTSFSNSTIAVPTTLQTLTKSSSSAATSGTAVPEIKKYYQCGGRKFQGKGACERGSECKFWNEWYSQCV